MFLLRPFMQSFAPFHSEGLGHFPTSNFQPTHRRTGGRKYGKGYSFPMLATKVFSSLVTTTELPICQKRAKEKRRNLQRLQRFLNHIQFAGHIYLSSFSTSEISFAVAVTIRMPLSLILSRRASSCRRFVSFWAGVSKRNWSTDIL